MSDHAFVRRAPCECAVAVVVQDDEDHWVQTVAAWQRARARYERVTVEEARQALGETFDTLKARGIRGAHPKGSCSAKQRATSAGGAG